MKKAVSAKIREREQRLIHACEVANCEPDVLAIEREWDAMSDPLIEPWTEAPTR